MKNRKQIKIGIDILMSVLLLFLMAFQVTGDKYHEWIGAGMLVLFLAHNILNAGWYHSLFKGKYSVARVLRTIINLAVLIAIILTGYSGIVMSRHVFDFLPIESGMALARKLHLAGSYWAFVLMSIHMGMHWSMVSGRIISKQDANDNKNVMLWILRILVLGMAVYGAFLFGNAGIYANMFLQNEFAMLDYESLAIWVIIQNLLMMSAWIYIGHYLVDGIGSVVSRKDKKEKIRGGIGVLIAVIVLLVSIVSNPTAQADTSWQGADADTTQETTETVDETPQEVTAPSEGFALVTGGTFEMGSPDSENWRSADETQHEVTVSDFYMSTFEVTQAEYSAVMGENPSNFSGENLPIENLSWLDAINYCNTRSEQEGLTPVYEITEAGVSWDRSADGYRLPTEAEWEYACRAGTTTPFNTETSISPEESNYYGHYPYDIEENYFEQENLDTQPGEYRETTVEVNSFAPNAWGLYNMHGNVSEWVWDYYGTYDTSATNDPTGPDTGSLKVYRGGGWNDFAKNMRSAYRATLEENLGSFNIGIRLVRNAENTITDVIGAANTEAQSATEQSQGAGKVLIAYFSWSGNTRGVAEEIQSQTGADLFEITLVDPYSDDYNTVLDESQHDQNIQARPEIEGHVDNMDEYDTILLGYPNWWASIPMPIASFLEQYDFSGKTIIPFCSHGGGRFGQSQTAIAKLAPDAVMDEGLSIHYSGGGSMSSDVTEWLKTNGIIE